MPGAQRQTWPVPISTANGGVGATLVWRWQGRLYLTAVVKATFAVVPGGAMTLVTPEPIASDEQEHGGDLRTAGDLVPFRRRAEVVITGHAVAPQGRPGAEVRVRLTVIRDGVLVLDKSLSLTAPAESGRYRLFGLGPLSRRWPIRSRLIEEHDARRFEGASIDLPPVFDESYFQAAPLDQRLDALQGDERIIVDGALPRGARIESRLPGVRAAAMLHEPAEEPGDPGALDLAMDTLHVDVDQMICNVTWRGTTTVDRREDLASMRVVAALELSEARTPAARDDADSLDRRVFPGVIIAPIAPPPSSSPPLVAQPSPFVGAEQNPLDATAVLPPELNPASTRSPSPLAPAEPEELESTRTAVTEIAPPSTPFPPWAAGAPWAGPSPGPRPLPPIPSPPRREVQDHPLGATSSLDAEAASDLRAKPATPFDGVRARRASPAFEVAPIEELDASELEDSDSVDDLKLQPGTFSFARERVDPPVDLVEGSRPQPPVLPPAEPLPATPPIRQPPAAGLWAAPREEDAAPPASKAPPPPAVPPGPSAALKKSIYGRFGGKG